MLPRWQLCVKQRPEIPTKTSLLRVFILQGSSRRRDEASAEEVPDNAKKMLYATPRRSSRH